MEKETQQKISVACILQDIRKDLWVALAMAISCTMLFYIGIRMFHHPEYTSSTTFILSSKENVASASLNAEQMHRMTDSFQSVMTNPVLKKKAAEAMKESRFPGSITVSVVPETNLITVSVHAETPEKAFRGLKSIMECYPQLGNKVMGEMVLDIFEPPMYPSKPDGELLTIKAMAICFLGVFAVFIFFIGFVSFMKETIKNEKEIPVLLDTTMFGLLWHEKRYKKFVDAMKRKKCRILLNNPYTSFGYKERMKKICTKLLYQMNKKDAQIVLVTSAEAGEGKSTIAVNLAQAIAQRNKKVLLIEGNLREPGIAKCMGKTSLKDCKWSERFQRHMNPEKIMIQPEGFEFQVLLNNSPVANPQEVFRSGNLKEFLEECKKFADIIVIDGPCVNRRSDIEILAEESEVSLMVVKQNKIEARYINDAIDLLESYGCNLLGCVFNDVIRQKNILSSAYGYSSSYGYGKYDKDYDKKLGNMGEM